MLASVARSYVNLTLACPQCLDTGAEFKFDHVHSKQDVAWAFGDALLQLLDALPEPLLPTSLHPRCTEVTSRDEAFEVSGY